MAILKSKQPRAGHAAGIYADLTLDGPEIGTLVAVVDRAKNLPNRRAMGKQDPYCAMRLAKEAKKTNTDRRGGQTPRWDQELRFEVHDSPDYYKLKCSIFNDDKKTELIGEAFIDLEDVIKLGGGQRDFWQQLSYKGKYAGDIRMELTFYDTREQPQERRRRERASQPTDSGSDISLPTNRSLGPREIKRRPLPANPGSAQPSPAPIDPNAPQRPPKVTQEEYYQHEQPIHAPVAMRPLERSPSPLPSQEMQDQYYDEPTEYAYHTPDHFQQDQFHGHHRAQSLPVEQQQPWQYPLGRQHRDYQPENHKYPHIESAGQQQMSYPDEQETWKHQQRPQSVHTHCGTVTPQHFSPAYRPTPTSANSDSQLVRFHQQQRHELTPSRGPAHADSPLRQSMSQHEMYAEPPQLDALPPLPPKHRETPPKRPRNEFPPMYLPQPLRVGQKRSSVHDRSPLQSLEDDYLTQEPQQRSAPQTPQYQPEPQRHSMYVALPPQHHEQPQQQLELYGRHRDVETQAGVSDLDFHQQRPASHSRQNSYEIRSSSYGRPMMDESSPMTPYDRNVYDEALQPTVEDAPPSPGLQPVVARKAVGAQPKRLSAVPFGPDAYDVLNPSSSPTVNEKTKFETVEQAKESQRMREVEKVRDLGPIIGNDGREIDPSDHLPSDTWAPEPERKNRKPEHVIHIRSKNDRPSGARASPVVVRHHANSASASPAAIPQPASSPASRTTPNSWVGGRNRLQKAVPGNVRPLPNQPYSSPTVATISSSALASSPQQHQQHEPQFQSRQAPPRKSSYDNRVPSNLDRPPLSEYQVPVGNSYAPRNNSYNSADRQSKAIDYQTYDGTPTKQPPQSYNYSSSAEPRRQSNDRRVSVDRRNSYDNRSDYSFENHVSFDSTPQQIPRTQQRQYDDPLAAEMSMIDLGPSRSSYGQGSMGRTMARRW